ncbi:polyphosphate kinase 2 [Polynucleobacter asymbioticus]|uniref:polyphosphate kinase 2 n=1 Tax=Polynucleobacter asymbioticus TaxID=576611 RepID=UPI001BFD0BA1|nr:polyphosphate kinase 2 [Polynucleobacter asymbioticus]QWD86011.1 polyphosphate kinase 2 [Polynucleobacter asymbioticus]
MSKSLITENTYEADLRLLQIELVKLQRHIIQKGKRLLVIFEGRDTAGKDGSIKSITENLSPRDTKIVALAPPSSLEEHEWYFQRYVAQLPSNGETVLFNRSWYNRAGVEKVMGFCTDDQYKLFMATVNDFESLLVRSNIQIIKYYLDISKEEQAKRLKARAKDPLKQWKISPIDQKAQKMWNAYSEARDEMLKKTNSSDAPWTVICADDKKLAHLNLIANLLSRVTYPGQDKQILKVDPQIVLSWPENSKKLPKLAK